MCRRRCCRHYGLTAHRALQQIGFPVRLENSHVIAPTQVLPPEDDCVVSANASLQIWAGVMPVGPSGGALNSSFRTRDTPEYKLELGSAIEAVARVVPDGLLVFFPSYSVMTGCLETWQASGEGLSVWCA